MCPSRPSLVKLQCVIVSLRDSRFVWCSRSDWRLEGRKGKCGHQSAAPPRPSESLAQEHRKLWKCLSKAGVGHVCLLSADWLRTVTAAQQMNRLLSYLCLWKGRGRGRGRGSSPQPVLQLHRWKTAERQKLLQPPQSLDSAPNWTTITQMQIDSGFISLLTAALSKTNTAEMLDIRQSQWLQQSH